MKRPRPIEAVAADYLAAPARNRSHEGARDVSQYKHVVVGQRYRITEQWAARLQAAGCYESAAEHRRGGIVTAITVSDRYGWDSCTVALDSPVVYADGSGHASFTTAADHLEAAPTDSEAAQ